MHDLSIDIETFSSVDIGACGHYKYAASPDFKILLFAFSIDGGDVEIVDLTQGKSYPIRCSSRLLTIACSSMHGMRPLSVSASRTIWARIFLPQAGAARWYTRQLLVCRFPSRTQVLLSICLTRK